MLVREACISSGSMFFPPFLSKWKNSEEQKGSPDQDISRVSDAVQVDLYLDGTWLRTQRI
jgi:hypothetical protein